MEEILEENPKNEKKMKQLYLYTMSIVQNQKDFQS